MKPLTVLRVLALVSLFLFYIQPTLADLEDSPVEQTAVVTLNEDNFNELTKQGSWLLDFYAPWCSFCNRLSSIWEQAARKLQGKVQFGKIDCTVEKGLQSRFGIKSYPTLKFWRDGEARTYKGDRTVEELVRFGLSMTESPVSVLPTANHAQSDSSSAIQTLQQFQQENPVVMLYVGPKGPQFSVFEKVAYRLQGTVKFAASFEDESDESDHDDDDDDDLDKHLSSEEDELEGNPSSSFSASVKGFASILRPLESAITLSSRFGLRHLPAVLALSKGSNTPPYWGPFEQTSLRYWVENNTLPLISELGGNNFDEVTSSGILSVFAVTDPAHSSSQPFLQTLLPIARKFRGQLIFAHVDGAKFAKYISQFGLNPPQFPTVFVTDIPNEIYYHRPENPTVTEADEIEAFLQQVLDGTIPAIGTLPWYSPSRWVKLAERWLSRFSESQLVVGLFVALGAFAGILLLICCLDAPQTNPAAGTAGGQNQPPMMGTAASATVSATASTVSKTAAADGAHKGPKRD